EQAREHLAAVGKRNDARPLFSLMRFARMPAAMAREDPLELADDLIDAVGQQAGKPEVAKRTEKILLLVGEGERGHGRIGWSGCRTVFHRTDRRQSLPL